MLIDISPTTSVGLNAEMAFIKIKSEIQHTKHSLKHTYKGKKRYKNKLQANENRLFEAHSLGFVICIYFAAFVWICLEMQKKAAIKRKYEHVEKWELPNWMQPELIETGFHARHRWGWKATSNRKHIVYSCVLYFVLSFVSRIIDEIGKFHFVM